jgi:aromatase
MNHPSEGSTGVPSAHAPVQPAPAGRYEVRHTVTINASDAAIFGALRDLSHWPELVGVTAYAERISGTDRDHVLRISAVVEGTLHASSCRRVFDPAGRRLLFQRTDLQPPLLALTGHWQVSRIGGAATVELQHQLTVAALDPSELAAILDDVADNSRRELEALRLVCERPATTRA